MSTPTHPPASQNFYRQPVLLDSSKHRGKRVRPTPGFRIAAHLNACMLAAGEWAEAAKEFVIAFVPAGPVPNGSAAGPAEVSPVALLGLREGENLFVEADGRWGARYVPAFIRRYPLAYARSGTGSEQHVIVDAAFEGLNDSDGELLVNDDGSPAPYLQEMMTFLDAYESDLERTRRLCARIVELDLLRAVSIDVTLPDGQKLSAGGVQVVDEARLKALPDEVAIELLRNGVLGLLHAQLISTTNVARLTERLEPRLAAAASP